MCRVGKGKLGWSHVSGWLPGRDETFLFSIAHPPSPASAWARPSSPKAYISHLKESGSRTWSCRVYQSTAFKSSRCQAPSQTYWLRICILTNPYVICLYIEVLSNLKKKILAQGYVYWFLEREWKGERETLTWETLIVASHMCPNQGSNLQSWYMPWPGI